MPDERTKRGLAVREALKRPSPASGLDKRISEAMRAADKTLRGPTRAKQGRQFNAQAVREIVTFARSLQPREVAALEAAAAVGGWPQVKATLSGRLDEGALLVLERTYAAERGFAGLAAAVQEHIGIAAAQDLASYVENLGPQDRATIQALHAQGGPDLVARALMQAGLPADVAGLAHGLVARAGPDGLDAAPRWSAEHSAAEARADAEADEAEDTDSTYKARSLEEVYMAKADGLEPVIVDRDVRAKAERSIQRSIEEKQRHATSIKGRLEQAEAYLASRSEGEPRPQPTRPAPVRESSGPAPSSGEGMSIDAALRAADAHLNGGNTDDVE